MPKLRPCAFALCGRRPPGLTRLHKVFLIRHRIIRRSFASRASNFPVRQFVRWALGTPARFAEELPRSDSSARGLWADWNHQHGHVRGASSEMKLSTLELKEHHRVATNPPILLQSQHARHFTKRASRVHHEKSVPLRLLQARSHQVRVAVGSYFLLFAPSNFLAN